MEAPLKSKDGPALKQRVSQVSQFAQRSGRQLIGRISTLPPIAFLKTRRRKPVRQIGFDQPRAEIERLAIRLPPARPSRIERTLVRAGDLAEAGTRTVRQTFAPMIAKTRSLGTRAVDAARSAVARIETRILAPINSWLQPAAWPATQTVALMSRTRRLRSGLSMTVAGAWLALSVTIVSGIALSAMAAHLAAAVVFLLTGLSLALHAWYWRCVNTWRSMELFICGECGELRNFLPSTACPRCGDAAPPVCPGQVPDAWGRNLAITSAPVIAGPAVLTGIILVFARFFV